MDEHISVQQQQQYQTPLSRGTNSSSMGRLNGRQMGHPSSTGMTTLVSSSTGSTYPHRSGMMMAQHVPHYQLPPTPPHHPIHPHLTSYGVQHPHHVANNSFSTKDVMDNDMLDNDPTTLLKQAPSGSKFIPAGNQKCDPFFFVLFSITQKPTILLSLLVVFVGSLSSRFFFAHQERADETDLIKRTPGNNFCA